MAKEDFCYTHYDGDEARDVSHMNRLERGGYMDIRIAQRKFGRMTENFIKKILGADFEICWPSIEIILKKDDEGKFYIEWLENSILKSRKHSKLQKEKTEKRWSGSTNYIPDEYQDDTETKNGITDTIPLEDGNEDGYGNEKENKNEIGTGENFQKFLIPEMLSVWKSKKKNYPVDKTKDFAALGELAKFISDQLSIPYNPRDGEISDKILDTWGMMAEFISKTDHINSYNLAQVAKYSQTIVQKIQHESTNPKTKTGAAKVNGEQLNRAFAEFYQGQK